MTFQVIFQLFTISYVRMLCFIGGRVISGCQHWKCHQHRCRASHSAGKGRGKWNDKAVMQTLALKIHGRQSESISLLQSRLGALWPRIHCKVLVMMTAFKCGNESPNSGVCNCFWFMLVITFHHFLLWWLNLRNIPHMCHHVGFWREK